MNQNKVLSVRNIVLIAMFSALAAVLETIQVAVPFAPPFYKLDFAELPVLIGGFAMGPAQAALIAIVKNLLKLLLNGTSTYYVGFGISPNQPPKRVASGFPPINTGRSNGG